MRFKSKIISTGLALSAILLLTGCENNQQKQAKEQQRTQQMKKIGDDETLPSGNYFEQDDQHKLMTSQQRHALNNVTQQMNHNYRRLGVTKYDKDRNTITLYLQGKQSQQLLKYLRAKNSSAKHFWNQLTSGLKKSSTAISKQTKDKSLVFQIKSISNQVLYATSDGKTIHSSQP